MPGYNNLDPLQWILGIRKVEIVDKRKMTETICLRMHLILEKRKSENLMKKIACSNSSSLVQNVNLV